ncbi:MAG: peptidylprolyl isomerase [Archangium sp.]|nr:peptidylprolyl isomerase [Archangium sp.]MDP3157741.1 peptidylprolyl isomerase [Archangium sp.]MDP3575260.1 peptidylprolyl isomerase [Archangium sp.]
MTRLLLGLALVSTSVLAADGKFMTAANKGKDLYATISTSKGDVVIKLFSKEAPRTVANFVGLATGEKEFTDPKTGKPAKKAFYDGLVFHRVIEGFMIQGGDPEGTGSGGPGYSFEDEFKSGRGFDKVGLLAMANRGPATNGSQFFITTSTPAHLNGKHTIFGEVITGYEVVAAISTMKNERVVMKKVTISDKAPKAAVTK